MARFGARVVDNGYSILPIKPRDKAPGRWDGLRKEWTDLSKWSRYCTRPPTERELDSWEQWPDAGIGIACGNVVGLDIDVLDVGLAIRCEELAREIIGDTPAVRFGRRPKRMLVYRCDEPFESFDARPLQVYALGRQFVAFGIHPDTNEPYDWPLGSPDAIDRADLPPITKEQAHLWATKAAELLGAKAPTPVAVAKSAGDNEPATFEAVEQALRFVPSTEATSRREWVEIGMAIKAGLGEAGRELWHSWSAQDGSRYTSKECDKQWDSFKNERSGGIGVGTLFDRARSLGWHPDGVFLYQRDADVAHAAVEIDPSFVANIIKRTGIKPQPPVEPEQPAPTRWTVPAGLPSWRRELSGGLQLFVDHCEATSVSPQPWVSLGGALAMFGALAGRRYASPTDLRTNVYCIGIADSGGGKNHPLRMVSSVLAAAGLDRFLGGEKIASGGGLTSALERQPSIVFPVDEIGFLIAAAADRKRSPKHLTEILDGLTQFYSTAAYTFLGTEYANKKERPRQLIEQPCLCLYGLTTPTVFWGSLSSGNVMDGSLARMLIFESEHNYPDERLDLERVEVPDDLVTYAKAIVDGKDGHNALPIGDTALCKPTPAIVPYADERARQRARDISEEKIRLLRSYEGTPLTSIIARLAENAIKVALIRAVADNPPDPSIDASDLEWGYDIAEHSVDTVLRAVEERVADNEHEATLKRVLKVITEGGSAGIALNELTRRTQWLRDKKHRMSIIDDLIEAGQVRADRVGLDPSRQRTVYYAL